MSASKILLQVILILIVVVGLPHQGNTEDVNASATGNDDLPEHALKRLGSLRFLSKSAPDRIGYSPDGRYLATGAFTEFGSGTDGIHIWDRQSGRDVTPGAMKGLDATGFAWDSSENTLATTHQLKEQQANIRIWSMGSKNPTQTLDIKPPLFDIDWSSNGDLLAVRSTDEVIIIERDGAVQQRFGFTSKIRTYRSTQLVDFTPDGTGLVTLNDEGVVRYDVSDGKVTAKVPLTLEWVNGLKVLPDGKLVAVATEHGVEIYELETSRRIVTLGKKIVVGMSVSSNGAWLATTGLAGSVGDNIVWDMRKLRPAWKLPQLEGGVAFSPDDSELAISTRRTTFLKTGSWELLSGQGEHHHQILAGEIVDDHIWTGESEGSRLLEWDLATGESIRALHRPNGHTSRFAVLGEDRIVVGGYNSGIDVMDSRNDRVVATLNGRSPIVGLAYCSTNNQLFLANSDGFIRTCHFQSDSIERETRFTMANETQRRIQVVAANDGKKLACSDPDSGEIGVFRTMDTSELWRSRLFNHQVLLFPMAFDSENSQLATIADSNHHEYAIDVCFLDAETGKEQSRLRCGSGTVHCLALSPDGKLVAFSSRDDDGASRVKLWSRTMKKKLAVFDGHIDIIPWVGFTNDSNKLISVSQDTTGVVWDTKCLPAQSKAWDQALSRLR